jgi:hypothetical protein
LAPPNRGGLNSTHIHGAHAPVEEPSTASQADAPRTWSATEMLSYGSAVSRQLWAAEGCCLSRQTASAYHVVRRTGGGRQAADRREVTV